jgi:membrane associated rhomboid family serine protease
MRGRYPAPAGLGFSFGPGGITPAIKLLIAANVAAFVLAWVLRDTVPITGIFGLRRSAVLGGALWQPFTYMFLHGGFGHILFNMLALWMFGVELERMWGTRFFLKYYFVCGVGAAATTILVSFVPPLSHIATAVTIGASGAIYGILLAYALYFPNRPIYIYFVFPVPAKYFVMIMGGITLLSSMSAGDGVAHITHLGGLVVGYLYLKGGRPHIFSELQYRFLKWRINRMRRKFDVYSGGRANDVDRRVH